MLAAKAFQFEERFCKADLNDLLDLLRPAEEFRRHYRDGPFVAAENLFECIFAARDSRLNQLPVRQLGAEMWARRFVVNAGNQSFVLQGRSAHPVFCDLTSVVA